MTSSTNSGMKSNEENNNLPPIGPFSTNDDLKEKYLHDKRVEFEASCNAGVQGACFSLGEWWQLFGKDEEKATNLFNSSCTKGKVGNACLSLAKMYFANKDMDPEDKNKLTVKYMDLACKYKNTHACGILGSFKLVGEGCTKNVDEAKKLFQEACEENDASACFKLGRLYIDGARHGVSRDPSQAFQHMNKGCDLGNANACQILAVMYTKGDGVEKDAKLAEEYKERTYEILRVSGDRLGNTKYIS